MNKAIEISEYELEIQKNIEERKKMFEMLQLNSAKQALVDVTVKVKPVKTSKRNLEIDSFSDSARKLPNKGKSTQFGVKKHWYELSIMMFYKFSEETKKVQPHGKQDVIGSCIFCGKEITGQIILIRNWKNHLQNCHQDIPEWKEYIKKTLEIKEQRRRNSSGLVPSSFMSMQKQRVQHTLGSHTLSPQPLLRMSTTHCLKEVRDMTSSPSLQESFKQRKTSPLLSLALKEESVAFSRPDSTISECCMIEETVLPNVKSDSSSIHRTIQTRGQSKRLGALQVSKTGHLFS
ncbi:uncharacterized protein LOC124342802 isoform X2 [Daphnia pulicaria]|uniref:uncharacterized protein LOC124342802 isoform X2 n=1 Tax=Daphnia pulicaria TaxID=35523 RepID=UPI001EEAD8B2|nr:uncharacterized protein LOC124342802 isoform X2 [Daphnia pulicaria]